MGQLFCLTPFQTNATIMEHFNEHEQGAPFQPATGVLPFLTSEEDDEQNRYFAPEEAVVVRCVDHSKFMDNDDAMDSLAPFDTDVWRAVDVMTASQSCLGFDLVEMPNHEAAPLKQFGEQPSVGKTSLVSIPLDSLPLPPLPAASISVFGAGAAASGASTPQDYCAPSVTCWTAFKSADADKTVTLLENFINAKGAKLTRRNYTLTVVDGDMRAVIQTSRAHDGCFTTMCRRLSGDSVLFNSLFRELLASVNGEPTVCYPAGCKEAYAQESGLNVSSVTGQHVV